MRLSGISLPLWLIADGDHDFGDDGPMIRRPGAYHDVGDRWVLTDHLSPLNLDTGAGYKDIVDTVVTIINNFEPVRRNGKVDRVNRNDKRFSSKFPFLAPPHQPLARGATDGTQN